MRGRHPVFSLRVVATTACLLIPCCQSSPPPPPSGSNGIFATGVTLELPGEDGAVVIRGDRLQLDRTGDSATVEGNVSLRAEGTLPLEVSADRLEVNDGGTRLTLRGRVHASSVRKDAR